MSSENEKDQIEEEVDAITSQLLNKPGNLTKYTSAAEIAQKALSAVIAACVDNAKIIDICKIGDSFILDAVKGLYAKDKTMKKGLAFPTCVSPASILCHLSPLAGEKEDQLKLSVGEVVRIELGAHIDGFAAQVAHTLVVGASKESPVMGLQADVLQCVHVAGEVAIRLMKPGNTSTQIAKAIETVAKDFGCLPVEGMQSNQISQNCLDGEKIIVVNSSEQQKKEIKECVLEEGEAYTVDILISSGDGKSKPYDSRTTVYKRNPDTTYQLKMKTSRVVLSEIDKSFGNMAFSLSNFEDPKKAKLGITECTTHALVTPYQVLQDTSNSQVAHYMFTVLIMPQGPLKITAPPFNQDLVKSEKTLQDEGLKELLKSSVRNKKKNKKKATA